MSSAAASSNPIPHAAVALAPASSAVWSPFAASNPLSWLHAQPPAAAAPAASSALPLPITPIAPSASSTPAAAPVYSEIAPVSQVAPPPHAVYPPPPPAYGAPAPTAHGAPTPTAPGGFPYPPPAWITAAASPYGAPPSAPTAPLYGASPSPYAAPYAAFPSTFGGYLPYYGSYSPLSYGVTAPTAPPSAEVYAPVYNPPTPPSAVPADSSAPAPFYFAHLIPVKLTPDNYLSWRAQVLPLLRSRYLEGYVDGTLSCPSPYHLAYHTWVA